MLVLRRKIGERIKLGREGEAAVEVVAVSSEDSVRLGFEVPRDWKIHREEVYSAILAATKITGFSFTVPPAGQHDCTDVTVTLSDGSRWRATCCSYAALAAQVEKNRDAGDNLCGSYFCLPAGMLLVDDATEAILEGTIKYLLAENAQQFQTIFQRVHNG